MGMADTLVEQYAAKIHTLPTDQRINWLVQSGRLISDGEVSPGQALVVIEFLRRVISDYTRQVCAAQHSDGEAAALHARCVIRALEDFNVFFEPLLTGLQCALAEDARPFQ